MIDKGMRKCVRREVGAISMALLRSSHLVVRKEVRLVLDRIGGK